jgi:hypothetical protein
LLTSPQKYLYGRAWSPDGSTLAYIHAAEIGAARGLSLISADGKVRRELVPDCNCTFVSFSPDGTHVAYDGADAEGNGRLILQPLAGGEPVVLTGLPSTNGGRFAFSPDGRWVRAELSDGSFYSSYPLLFLAETTRSGSFVKLASNFHFTFSATPSYDYVAAILQPPGSYVYSAAVFPTAGGASREPVSTGVMWLEYSQVASAPRLAVLSMNPSPSQAFTLALFNPDGSGAPDIALPEVYSSDLDWGTVRPFWVGPWLLHSVNQRTDPRSGERVFDLAAVSQDGKVSGLVARDVLRVSYSRARPSRIFFTRSRQSGGGLWMLELPPEVP